MKKILFGLIAIVLFGSMSYGQKIIYSNCSLRTGDKIGIDDKGIYNISVDKEKLLEDFSIIAKESGLDLKYNNVEILNVNPDKNLNYFGLYAHSGSGATTAISLVLDNGVFKIDSNGGTISCSSVGCTGFGCTAYDTGISKCFPMP